MLDCEQREMASAIALAAMKFIIMIFCNIGPLRSKCEGVMNEQVVKGQPVETGWFQ